MGLKDDSHKSSPTVEDLILQLRSSFFASEFQKVAKTLTEREERMKVKYLNQKKKVEEEKDAILKENLKLQDELMKKDEEIDALRKMVDGFEAKLRVYENPSDDHLTASFRPPLFREKGSKKKIEAKSREIINLDDDDDDDDQGKRAPNEAKREYNSEDDDLEVISSIKRRRLEREIKRTQCSKEIKSKHDDDSPYVGKIELDSPEPAPVLDTETIGELYKSSINRMKKQKEGWKLQSDMVKDLEKDDELCLNGVCALHRQRIIVHWSDTSSLSTLARMLIDGDPQNELKKNPSDLNHLDLDKCRMYAKKYALQLFNIYIAKSDPFFPTS